MVSTQRSFREIQWGVGQGRCERVPANDERWLGGMGEWDNVYPNRNSGMARARLEADTALAPEVICSKTTECCTRATSQELNQGFGECQDETDAGWVAVHSALLE